MVVVLYFSGAEGIHLFAFVMVIGVIVGTYSSIYIASPLLYRDHLFIVKEGGIISSVEITSGKTMKQGRVRGGGNYYASPVAGDGKLYLINEAGVLSVVRAAGAWELLSSHDFAERTMATPAIVDGRIYVRTEKRLYCFAKP